MGIRNESRDIGNISSDAFAPFMERAAEDLGMSHQECAESLRELIDAGYIHVTKNELTSTVMPSPEESNPDIICKAVQIVFADITLSLEEKMVHNYCAMMVQSASGFVSIDAMSTNLRIPTLLIYESLEKLKCRNHIDYAIVGKICLFTLLHALEKMN